jgi:rod shape-determining protein MreB and related proteins
MLMRLLPASTSLCGWDIAVDLGTANTVVSARGGELVVSEPSIVAVDARTGGPLAAGTEALELLGRDGVAELRPLKDGVIVELDGAVAILRHLLRRVRRYRRPRPRLIASVSSGASDVHRRAVAEACMAAGAREARLIAKPLAAALGSGLPVGEPTGSMVLDIGAGTSEMAMISMGSIVTSRSIAVAGDQFDQRIAAHLKREQRVVIGAQTAERIKVQLGSASPLVQEGQIEVVGRDLASEMLKTVRLTSQEVRGVLERPLARIIEATKETLAGTPPELAADVIDRGITLTGGGSLLPGLAVRVGLETAIPVQVAENACTCTAIGPVRSVDHQLTRSQPAPRPALVVTSGWAAN